MAVALGLAACKPIRPLPPGATFAPPSTFDGAAAGESRQIAGVPVRWCPAGTFTMGSPVFEPERRPGEDQVQVLISKGFWVGQHEVTQGEWQRIVGAAPEPFNVGEGAAFPMYRVNFAEAEDFCLKLTATARASGDLPADWEFRLPTEAQWEYAARAGTTAATSFGAALSSKQANFRGAPYNGGEPGPSLDRTVPVGSYPANPWGLRDVHGNVFEWCRDWAREQLPGGVDPDLHAVLGDRNESGSFSRIRRGGCYADPGWACRSAFRLRFEPERRHEHIGFRVVAVRP
ncbi:MAG: formylglycine-generating enzyme family protein [Candidatus Sericytochromatia bacterium]|nr:formylglycine-generating enzyme family protein [Candidatus Tanganyikabacteria bacterium]